MGRNLVVCCDGTNNDLGGSPTNVLRLAKVAERSDPELQVVFYDTGVGTLVDHYALSRTRRVFRWALDQATGLSLRENFLDAYLFLIRNWRPGDRIMLFGFSRGAYTARCVAAAIHMFGLPRPECENQSAYIWQTIASEGMGENEMFKIGGTIKKHFGRAVEVDFLGVWDTVSAFGMLTGMRTVPHTRSNPSIKVIRHAVAIDERRSLFQSNRVAKSEKRADQDVIEFGFAGVHSDVGGGYPSKIEDKREKHGTGLAMISFDWMLKEAMHHGLLVNPERLGRVLDQADPMSPEAGMHESLEKFWKIVELLPVRKWSHRKERLAVHWPNFFRRRRLTGLTEHPSVAERRRLVRGYDPKNLR